MRFDRAYGRAVGYPQQQPSGFLDSTGYETFPNCEITLEKFSFS